MYWILDKGYLVYLFSVAYLQNWKWPFVFKTILAAYGTTKALIWHFRTKLDVSQTPAVWELFIFEVKGPSSSPFH